MTDLPADPDRLAEIRADLERRALDVALPDPNTREHYIRAMVVAQCAWDYVNPPDGHRLDPARLRLLERAVHELRRYELHVADADLMRGSL
jgi:hypothetical protein